MTQDMVIDILRDEQGHKRLFEGFLGSTRRKDARSSLGAVPGSGHSVM